MHFCFVYKEAKTSFMYFYKRLFIISLIFASCHNNNNQNNTTEVKNEAAPNDSFAINTSAAIPFEDETQHIHVDASKPVLVTGKKGLRIWVDASKLETTDGQPVSGDIDVSLIEMQTINDFIKNNCQTVSDGRLLSSMGSYKIMMYSGGKELLIKKGQTLTMQFPKIFEGESSLFYGERDSAGSMNWKATGQALSYNKTMSKAAEMTPVKNQIQQSVAVPESKDTFYQEEDKVLKLKAYLDKKNNDAENYIEANKDSLTPERIAQIRKEANSVSAKDFLVNFIDKKQLLDTVNTRGYEIKVIEKDTNPQNKLGYIITEKYYTPVEISRLGYINCDKFINQPVVPSFAVKFDSSAPVNIGVYICYKKYNAMREINIRNKSSNMVVSENLPIGEKADFILYGKKNRHFFACKRSAVISKDIILDTKFSPVPDSLITTFVIN